MSRLGLERRDRCVLHGDATPLRPFSHPVLARRRFSAFLGQSPAYKRLLRGRTPVRRSPTSWTGACALQSPDGSLQGIGVSVGSRLYSSRAAACLTESRHVPVFSHAPPVRLGRGSARGQSVHVSGSENPSGGCDGGRRASIHSSWETTLWPDNVLGFATIASPSCGL
jgi:hypothetical protein